MKNKLIFLLLLSVSTAGCGPWRLKGNEFEPSAPLHHMVQGQKRPMALSLRGVGVKTIFMLRVFIAGLYLKPDCEVAQALSGDQPKYLSVKFYVKIPSHEFAKYTANNMRPNLTAAEFEQVKPLFKRMGELFPDISKGDELVLDYEPGVGTAFVHNGKERGVIEGALFAKAIFGTWIGPKPIDHIIKAQVLGLKTR